jgi:hypothetical protein
MIFPSLYNSITEKQSVFQNICISLIKTGQDTRCESFGYVKTV